MVRLLVADVMRRHAGTYAIFLALQASFALAVFAASSRGTRAAELTSLGAMAISLGFTFFVGPFLALGALAGREFQILPISSRQVWLATWLLATVGATICATAGRLIVLLTAASAGRHVDTRLLFAGGLTDFIFCGACMGVVAAVSGSSSLMRVFRRVLVVPTPVIVVLLAAIGAIVVPGITAVRLARTGGDDMGVLLVVALGLTLTVIGYRHRPGSWTAARQPTKRADMRPSPGTPRAPRGHVASLAGDRVVPGIGLSGMRLLLSRELLWIGGGVIVVLVSVALIGAVLKGTAATGHAFADTFGGRLRFNYAGGYAPWVRADWFALLILNGRNAVAPMLRHLRTQPIAAWRLNACVLGLALPLWVSATGTYLAIHAALVGRVPAVSSSIVLGIGMTAMAHALQLPTGRAFASSAAGMPLVAGGLTAALIRLPAPLDVLSHPAIVGGLLVAAAAVINHLHLTRWTTAFRARPAER